ncbi:MAG: hypothetical protein HY423_08620 [Candidatus Lambdaproteobacteria bacterium]|nr:hypothetical protein [Candidatus Lambdaproteobacteria bacterium]
MDNTDKVVSFIADCHDMGVPVLPPDINHSGRDFTIDRSQGRAAVRFGLNAVKNVGANAVGVILAAREAQPGRRFAELAAFLKSVDLHRVNKRVIEALVKCGGFDSLEPSRARLLAGLDELVALGLSYRASQTEGQATLFDLLGSEEAAKADLQVRLPEVAPFSFRQRLKIEKEVLGFYITGHPLDRYRTELAEIALSTHDVREGEAAGEGHEVTLAGVVAALTVRLNQKAEKWAIVRLEDLRGSIEVLLYNRAYAQFGPLLQLDEPLLVRGTVRARGEQELNVVADQVTSLSQVRTEQARRLVLGVEGPLAEDALRKLNGVLAKAPGECRVAFDVRTANGWRVEIDSGLSFRPDEPAMEELEDVLRQVPFRFEYAKEGLLARDGAGGSSGSGNGHRNGSRGGNGNKAGNGAKSANGTRPAGAGGSAGNSAGSGNRHAAAPAQGAAGPHTAGPRAGLGTARG